MSLLIPIDVFDNFMAVKDFSVEQLPANVLADLVQKNKELDEREEFEPWLRSIQFSQMARRQLMVRLKL